MTTQYTLQTINPPVGNSQFTVTVGGSSFGVRLLWCDLLSTWLADILIEDQYIAAGVPVLPGVDLLRQFQYLGLGASLVVASMGTDPFADLTFTSFSDGTAYIILLTPAISWPAPGSN